MIAGVVDGSRLESALAALLASVDPGAVLLARLERADVASMDVDALHDHLADLRRVASVVAGLEHQALAALAGVDRPEGWGAAEVAASALDETTDCAERRLVLSERLVAVHPDALAGLLSGTVGPRHAEVLTRTCADLPDEVAVRVDSLVWDVVGEAADPSVVRREAKRLALAEDPKAAADRAAANRAKRHVSVGPGPEGTGWFMAQLATEDLIACQDSLHARTASKDPDDPRSRAQRMADLLVEDITGRPPLLVADGRWVGPQPEDAEAPRKARDRRVEIGVVIPLDVLAGLRDGHATIDGEPVPAEVARGLFASDGAVMRRMLSDPLTGELLDLSPQTYRPGKGLKRFIKTRDQQCWWPGCHRRARVCDEDHKTPFPAGPTTRVNLGSLCEHHHQLKHSGQWALQVREDGTIDLTGPHGQTVHVPHPRLHDQPSAWDPPPPTEATPDPAPDSSDDPPPF